MAQLALEHVLYTLLAKDAEENVFAIITPNVWQIMEPVYVVLVIVESHVTKPVPKVRLGRIVLIIVSVIMVQNVPRKRECVYAQPDGEGSNVIYLVKNRFTVKTVK